MAKRSSPASAAGSSSDVDPFDSAFIEHTPRGGAWSTQFPIPSDGPQASANAPADDSLRTLAMRQRSRSRAWIWRPALLIRLLWLLIVLMLATLTMFTGVLAHVVAGLSDDIREQNILPETPLEEPLPSAEQLLDDERFALILAGKPHKRSDLLLARAGHLLAADRHAEAEEIVIEALRPQRSERFTAQQVLQLVELCIQLGRFAQAFQLLEQRPMAEWTPEQRRRGTVLLARLHLRLSPGAEQIGP